MKNLRMTIVGVIALASAVTLNLRHALNDYGVKTGKLHTEVLATSSSGGSSSGSSSSSSSSSSGNYAPNKVIASEECKISETEDSNGNKTTQYGTQMNCKTSSGSNCDQSQVTSCSKIN